MQARKIIAVFDAPQAAQQARAQLVEMGIPNDRITIADKSSFGERTTQTAHGRGSFWAHVKEMFMPDRDRHMYEESMQRGGCMLVATVEDDSADAAIECLERAGAVDLDQREAQWRSEGWRPAETTASSDEPSTGMAEDTDQTARIPVVEERLRVGKREVNRGSVRVRSYIVEEPVHEEVRLREERVNVERRPVNQPARPVVKGSPEDLLQERTLEVSETAEQAVVGKEARVTEEVVVSKETGERVEPVDETVRRTKVEVDDKRQAGERTGRSGAPTRNARPPGRT